MFLYIFFLVRMKNESLQRELVLQFLYYKSKIELLVYDTTR